MNDTLNGNWFDCILKIRWFRFEHTCVHIHIHIQRGRENSAKCNGIVKFKLYLFWFNLIVPAAAAVNYVECGKVYCEANVAPFHGITYHIEFRAKNKNCTDIHSIKLCSCSHRPLDTHVFRIYAHFQLSLENFYWKQQ